MEKITASRLTGLDTMKALAALLVILIHSGYPGSDAFNQYLLATCRASVPLFLMISGYFYPIKKHKTNATIKHLGLLTLAASVFYFITEGSHFSEAFTFIKMRGLLFFNLPLAGHHLWYLFAMLYVMVIMLVCDKFKFSHRLLFYFIIPLLLVNYALSYSEKFWLYRNFLFTALPYFLLGCAIRERKGLGAALERMRPFLGLMLIGGLSLLYIEISIYQHFGWLVIRDHYIMTPLLVLVIFGYFLRDTGSNFINRIGREYSAYIYILHVFILDILEKSGWQPHFLGYIRPFLVMALTIFAVAAAKKIILVTRTGYHKLTN